MSRNSGIRFVLCVLALFLVSVFTSRPAPAQPLRRPAAGIAKVAVLGEGALRWVRDLLAGLLPQGTTKEGMSIDPDGSQNPQGTPVDPDGGLDGEGMSIDPNG